MVYMRKALANAIPFAHGRMLDVGCGLRPYQNLFGESIGSYIGIDYPTTQHKAHVDLLGNAMALPFADNSIDTLLATELLEHLPDPDQFLGQIARVLKPAGVFIFSVPFLEPLHEEPRDFYRFTPYSLRLMLARHGFQIEQIAAKGGWWSVVLGSFVSQGLYDSANPIQPDGTRRDGVLRFAVLPFCAALQWIAYLLDRVIKSSRYTLGYVVIATSVGEPNGSQANNSFQSGSRSDRS